MIRDDYGCDSVSVSKLNSFGSMQARKQDIVQLAVEKKECQANKEIAVQDSDSSGSSIEPVTKKDFLKQICVDKHVFDIAEKVLVERVDNGELELAEGSAASDESYVGDLRLSTCEVVRVAHFVVENLNVANVQFRLGESVIAPNVSEIVQKFGMNWLPDLFIGWDTKLDRLSRDTIVTAILKKNHTVTIRCDGEVLRKVSYVPDGKRANAVLKSIVSSGGFKEPFFDHYTVKTSSQVVVSDTIIEIETRESVGRHRVVFCVDLDMVGVLEKDLTDNEIYHASVIKEMNVADGRAAIPPDEASLASKGLKMPFYKFYEWDADFSYVNTDMFIHVRKVPIMDRVVGSVTDIIQQMRSGRLRKVLSFECGRLTYSTFEWIREKRMRRIFRQGTKIKTKDFTFSLANEELMLMSFSGVSMDVVVPAYVNNYPVRYVSPEFLNGGFGIVNNYRWRSFKNVFRAENVGKVSLHDVKSIASGIRSLVLPNTLFGLQGHCFHGCAALHEIVIPEGLQYVSPTTFEYCDIERLIFNGPCPKGLEFCRLYSKVYVRDEYYNSFSRVVLV